MSVLYHNIPRFFGNKEELVVETEMLYNQIIIAIYDDEKLNNIYVELAFAQQEVIAIINERDTNEKLKKLKIYLDKSSKVLSNKPLDELLQEELTYLTNLRNCVGVYNSFNLVNGILRLDEVFAFNTSSSIELMKVFNTRSIIELIKAFMEPLKVLDETELTNLIKNSILEQEKIPRIEMPENPVQTYNVLRRIAKENNFETLEGIINSSIKILRKDYFTDLSKLNLKELYNFKIRCEEAIENGFIPLVKTRLALAEAIIVQVENTISQNIDDNFTNVSIFLSNQFEKNHINYINYLTYMLHNSKDVGEFFTSIKTLDKNIIEKVSFGTIDFMLFSLKETIFYEKNTPEALVISEGLFKEDIKLNKANRYTEEQFYQGYKNLKILLNEKFPNEEDRIDGLLAENFSLLYSKLQTKSKDSFGEFLASKIIAEPHFEVDLRNRRTERDGLN